MNKQQLSEYTSVIALNVGCFVGLFAMAIFSKSLVVAAVSAIPFFLYNYTIYKTMKSIKE